jgi:choline dehydrogenase
MKQPMLILPLLFGAAKVAAESFDYIVVGAGTGGSVIANRLSEDPSVSVLVVEPGTDQRNNPNVSDWTLFESAFDTPIDWNYLSTAQPEAGNRQLALHQGKAWGGTSTINGGWLSETEEKY